MYKINFSPQGEKSLQLLDRETGQRVLDKLKWLAENITVINPLPLHGRLSGFYKLKVGDYRAVYELNHNEKGITVHKIGHRCAIYK
ncbi:MAG: type II toxin-antitoxin system RelE/ParE family toxin [Planctomycetes bacterium]|nr:type II toxin-antitoxin system RelE/ParE family toxin [Planctomycetota bacterium]